MANYTANRSAHKTLAAAAADKVTLTNHWDKVRIVNKHATEILTILCDGSANPVPTALMDNATCVIPGNSSRVIDAAPTFSVPGGIGGTTQINIGIIGNGNTYDVEGLAKSDLLQLPV
jgi:hypothetical protein